MLGARLGAALRLCAGGKPRLAARGHERAPRAPRRLPPAGASAPSSTSVTGAAVQPRAARMTPSYDGGASGERKPWPRRASARRSRRRLRGALAAQLGPLDRAAQPVEGGGRLLVPAGRLASSSSARASLLEQAVELLVAAAALVLGPVRRSSTSAAARRAARARRQRGATRAPRSRSPSFSARSAAVAWSASGRSRLRTSSSRSRARSTWIATRASFSSARWRRCLNLPRPRLPRRAHAAPPAWTRAPARRGPGR